LEASLDWYDFWIFYYLGKYQAANDVCTTLLEPNQWPRSVLLAVIRLRLALRDLEGIRALRNLVNDTWTSSVIHELIETLQKNVPPIDDGERLRSVVFGDGSALDAVDEAGRLLAALALQRAGLYLDALETLPLSRCENDAESRACRICLWLHLNRLDRAQLEQQALEHWFERQLADGDQRAVGTLVQLSRATLAVASNDAEDVAIEAALRSCRDLAERYGPSTKLLNLTYLCLVRLGRTEASESTLQQAMNLDAQDPDTMANTAASAAKTSMMMMAFPEAATATQRPIEYLRKYAPWHPWIRAQDDFERKLRGLAT
jgi:tetratricopeptide (TPR) repeat protein